MPINLTKLFVVISVSTVLTACNSKPVRDPDFAAVEPVVPSVIEQSNGSIYQTGFERSWFENIRARRVGDILLVTLVENTSATHTNSGTVSKANTTSIANPTIFGNPLQFRIPGVNSAAASTGASSLSSSTDFSGSADNTQLNTFTGSISVMVTDVLTNGYLKVRGEKRVSMTGGNEYVRVSGIIRPEDINTSNSIDSTKIADATLTYIGDGQTSESTTMGWLAKFFISALMPF